MNQKILILLEMKEFLSKNKWGQKKDLSKDCYCLMTALAHIAGARSLMGFGFDGYEFNQFIRFNDAPGRTKQECLDFIDSQIRQELALREGYASLLSYNFYRKKRFPKEYL